MIFSVSRNPYGEKYHLFAKKTVEINPGITVLAGCNGYGKSSLILEIKENLRKLDIPFYEYNDRLDGEHFADTVLLNNQMDMFATHMCSSEGERIVMHMGYVAQSIGSFITKNPELKDYFFLLDAFDSGLSIDNVIEFKNFFNFVIKNNPNKNIYFVFSTNQYEMCRESSCLDVHSLKYINFEDYEDFKKYILNSRKIKDNRKY